MQRIAVSLFALAAIVGSTSVQAAGADCAKDYKDFWDNNSPLAKSLTPEQYAQLSRTALRSIVSLEKMASAGSDGTSDLLRASAMALRQRHDMPLHDLDRMLELRREKMSGASTNPMRPTPRR